MGTFGTTRPKLTIDVKALKQNYRILVNKVLPAHLGAVVKANAYGIGIKNVVNTLSELGCLDFFVATIDEGIQLRQILPKARIYIFHGVEKNTADDLVHNSLTPVLNSQEQIENWLPYSDKNACLHIDTGMSRLGLKPYEINDVKDLNSYNFGMIMSHLACADLHDHPKNRKQLEAFNNIREIIKTKSASLANSSGIFLGPDYHFDLCRAGIALYGVNPSSTLKNPMLQVINLRAKILQVRSVKVRDTVGYGATHRFVKPSKLAIIGIGYADGYMRSLGNTGIAFVGEHKVPIVGRISMDLTTIDVTHVPDNLLSLDTWVDLIGPKNPIDEVANQAGTIGYELLTNFGDRIERRCIKSND